MTSREGASAPWKFGNFNILNLFDVHEASQAPHGDKNSQWNNNLRVLLPSLLLLLLLKLLLLVAAGVTGSLLTEVSGFFKAERETSSAPSGG